LAEITCIFEDKAVITLQDTCGPVELSDFAVPYKEEEVIKKKRLSYKRCVLPFSPVEGNVVYLSVFMEIARDHAATGNYVSIDIGKAFVSRGDYVLFYKRFKRSLPPLIIGLGIVVDPQNTNSTVRVIDCSNPIEIGARAILIPEPTRGTRVEKGEEVPIIGTREETATVEEQSIEFNALFKFDEKTLDPEQRTELDKIKEFVAAKSSYRVILRGYTCSIGDVEYNLKLSQERVEYIKNILVQEFNMNQDAIETYYYGEKEAPFDNSTEEQRRLNRAVDIQVIGK
jgi:outer membrane protein OmpA-like peptidoglycan-associated protein